MKVVLHIVLIAIAGAAAFFSMQESKKFQDQQAIRLETKKNDASVTANAEATEKNLKDERAALAKSREELALVKASIEALKSAETSLKRDIASIDTALEGQKTEFDELNKAVEEVNKLLAELGGGVTIDNLGDKIVEMEQSVKTKKTRVDELTTLIDGAQKKIETGKGESKRLADKATERAVRISRNSTEAVVSAVNQDWGFLVIAAGSNSGFIPQTSLLVQRDGKLIGRVHPSAVEATQTIADIDLDSLAPGVRIQPGDRVILAIPAAN